MSRFKKIIFPLFSLFLLWQSFEITRQVLATLPTHFSTREILFAAFLLALYITGIFAFVGFAYPTNQLLPNSYYQIKNPKRLSLLCRIIGMKYFKAFLLVFFWGWKKNRRKYFDGTRSGLQNFIYQAKQSEFGHLCAFSVVLLLGFLLLGFGHFKLFAVLTVLNGIGNFYPVVLQRQHRIRIERVICK